MKNTSEYRLRFLLRTKLGRAALVGITCSYCVILSHIAANADYDTLSTRDKCRIEAGVKLEGGADWSRITPETAVPVCEKAVSEDPKDSTSLARLARALKKAGRLSESLVAARQAAEAGDASGQFQYGNAFKGGDSIEKDFSKAIYWYKLAAKQGYADAEYNLAIMYRDGLGVDIDLTTVNEWLEKAAAQGHDNAQYLLGINYEFGRGIGKDLTKAFGLYKRSAKQGFMPAEKYISRKLYNGDITEKDYKEALYWMKQAADQGDAEAQKAVGSFYYSGVGVGKDEIEAVKWFRKAADQNYLDAQIALAQLYTDGIGVKKDVFEATKWYRRAADQGDTLALYLLGDAYREGIGIEKDKEEAFSLYKRAAELGDIDGQFRVIRSKILGSGVKQDLKDAQLLTEKYFDRLEWRSGFLASDFISAELYEYAIDIIDRVVSSENFQKMPDKDRKKFYKAISSDLEKCITVGKGGEKTIKILERLAATGMANAAYQIGLAYYQGDTNENDRPKALYWLKRAAEMGNVAAFNYVGVLYDNGFGAPTDKEESTRWFRLAADKKDPRGIGNLALQYAYGKGVDRDDKEALRLFRLAAELGDDLSLAALATMYTEGRPVLLRNPEEAANWYKIAAERGYTRAQERIISSFKRKMAMKRIEIFETNVSINKFNSGLLETFGQALNNRLKKVSRNDIERIKSELRGAMATGDFKSASKLHDIMSRDFLALDDLDTAIAEQVKGVLINRLDFARDVSDKNEYFLLLSESCNWGKLSRWSYDHNRKNEALYFAKRSVNILQDARKYLVALPDQLRECFLQAHQDRYRWLADLFIEQGRLVEAEFVLRLLKDFEFTEYVRAAPGSPDISGQHFSFTIAEKSADNAVEIAGKQLARLEARKAVLLAKSRAHTLKDDDQKELNDLDDLLDRARHSFSDQLDEIALAIRAMGRSTAEAERVSEQNLTKFQAMLADRVAAGGSAEAIIQTVVMPDRVHLLLSTPSFQQVKTVNIDQKNLNKMISEFRQLIQSRDDRSSELGFRLYQLLFRDFDEVLKTANIHTIAVSPDLGLTYLPFAALHDEIGYLVERYNFAVVTDPAYAVSPSGPGRDWRIATFGISKASHDIDALPSVAAELEGIARLAGDRALPPKLDDEFTKSELAYAAGRYEVVHLATHFMSTADESTSFLVLGNGARLSVQDLRKMRFSRTQLLTLSACDTAVPFSSSGGNQIDAVARSAQVIGGARSVVGTLWAVADSSTAVFMQELYSLLLNNPGLSKGEAIAQVQKKFIRGELSVNVQAVPLVSSRNKMENSAGSISSKSAYGVAQSYNRSIKPFWSKPFYWAPFLIMGNWS